MATTSGASALAGTRPLHAVGAFRSRRPSGHRLLSAVGHLTAFVWGEQQPAPPAPVDALRRAELAGISGPVAAGAHPAPTPPVDKRSVVAHYRALADQVAREQRRTGVAARQGQGMAHHA